MVIEKTKGGYYKVNTNMLFNTALESCTSQGNPLSYYRIPETLISLQCSMAIHVVGLPQQETKLNQRV